MAVAASHRRQGTGKRLVAEGLAALGRAGIQKRHLLVFAENAEGREFWRAVERSIVASWWSIHFQLPRPQLHNRRDLTMRKIVFEQLR